MGHVLFSHLWMTLADWALPFISVYSVYSVVSHSRF
jgi:hypothetical protein